MKYDELINQVRVRAGLEGQDAAERSVTAELAILGDRLAGMEPADLGAQLPVELKDMMTQHFGPAASTDSSF